IAVNFALSLGLMFWLRQGGIALATVLAALLNNALLLVTLHRNFRNYDLKLKSLLPELTGGFAVSVIAAAMLLPVYPWLLDRLTVSLLPRDLLPLLLTGGAFCSLYFAVTWIAGSTMPRVLLRLFKPSENRL
ncbi:MAG: hypothetical protein PHH77_11360, partial [Victivallaceae bacterium]|nr:hypothetical protein [Victivallaceae bacterium]